MRNCERLFLILNVLNKETTYKSVRKRPLDRKYVKMLIVMLEKEMNNK